MRSLVRRVKLIFPRPQFNSFSNDTVHLAIAIRKTPYGMKLCVSRGLDEQECGRTTSSSSSSKFSNQNVQYMRLIVPAASDFSWEKMFLINSINYFN